MGSCFFFFFFAGSYIICHFGVIPSFCIFAVGGCYYWISFFLHLGGSYNDFYTVAVAKIFLSLIDKHFPKNSKLCKIFNRNTIKVSYSCLSKEYHFLCSNLLSTIPHYVVINNLIIYIYIYIYIYNFNI